MTLAVGSNADTIVGSGAWRGKVAVVTATRACDGATADVSYTGVGFAPKAVLVVWVLQGNPNIGVQLWAPSVAGGFHSATKASDTCGNFWSTNCVDCYPSGGGRQYGALKSFDADGMTISWIKTSSPASATINLTFIFFG